MENIPSEIKAIILEYLPTAYLLEKSRFIIYHKKKWGTKYPMFCHIHHKGVEKNRLKQDLCRLKKRRQFLMAQLEEDNHIEFDNHRPHQEIEKDEEELEDVANHIDLLSHHLISFNRQYTKVRSLFQKIY